MGGTSWSAAEYTDRVTSRAARGEETFAYSSATMRSAPSERVAHNSLDPKGVALRESRDSEAHPESRAIITALDVTGSMSRVPPIIQSKLPGLMGLLIRDGGIPHPQIMTAAIGDASCDRVPMQIGQFESGIEIENDLTNLVLEKGGGSNPGESYELFLYFVARHTETDCWSKRNKKGFLFLIADEPPYPAVKKAEVEKVFGDVIQSEIPTPEIMAEVLRRYEVFYIVPGGTQGSSHDDWLAPWREMLGQHVIRMEDPDKVCEVIASTIAVLESGDWASASEAMRASGSTPETIDSVGRSLAPLVREYARAGSELAVASSGAESGVAVLD
jgi:hypothetical protein